MMTTKEFDGESAKLMVKGLRETFSSGITKSYEWRISQLNHILEIATCHEQEIVDALRSDIAKPDFESLIYEICLIKKSCKLAIRELKRWMKPEKVSTTLLTFPSTAEIVAEPFGVVLIISTWNFPFLISLDPVIGAIAAGNTVVLKPSELSPATSALLAKYVGEYMDSAAVKVVEGAISETSALLEQKWDKILYTGNSKIARIVMAAAAKHLTPVVLELGGKSPVIVDSDINLKVAVSRIASGKWGCNNGQACIGPDYIITTKDFAPKLVDSLKQHLAKFYGDEPLKSNDISRIVNSNHFNRLIKLLDDDKVSDKIVHGGQRDVKNLRIAPTILLDVPDDSLIMSDEIFGPLLAITTVDHLEDSFNIINSGPKPLAAYLFTNNKKLKEKFVSDVSAGGMLINDTILHLSVPTLPFGGVGESGMGGYHGKFSFDTFSHKKGVLYRTFLIDFPQRYPPYTPRKLAFLKAVIKGSFPDIFRAIFYWP